jgi:copper chaperone CopZ
MGEEMEIARFVIPGLDGPGMTDLGNALVALSGVARIDIDATSHAVSVEYDPAFVSRKLIGDMIRNAGYSDSSAGPRAEE